MNSPCRCCFSVDRLSSDVELPDTARECAEKMMTCNFEVNLGRSKIILEKNSVR